MKRPLLIYDCFVFFVCLSPSLPLVLLPSAGCLLLPSSISHKLRTIRATKTFPTFNSISLLNAQCVCSLQRRKFMYRIHFFCFDESNMFGSTLQMCLPHTFLLSVFYVAFGCFLDCFPFVAWSIFVGLAYFCSVNIRTNLMRCHCKL